MCIDYVHKKATNLFTENKMEVSYAYPEKNIYDFKGEVQIIESSTHLDENK